AGGQPTTQACAPRWSNQAKSPRHTSAAPDRETLSGFQAGSGNRSTIAKTRGNAMKFNPGDMLPTTVMEAVTGEAINLPDPKRLVHLQFRRFVDCPICNTHIAEFRRRARETEAAGIKEVIVFHSSPKSIRSYQKDVPFLMVGDPNKAFYRDFGVESSLGFISLKALGAGLRG